MLSQTSVNKIAKNINVQLNNILRVVGKFEFSALPDKFHRIIIAKLSLPIGYQNILLKLMWKDPFIKFEIEFSKMFGYHVSGNMPNRLIQISISN